MKESVERPGYSADGWVFAVLTLDRFGSRGGKRHTSLQDAWRDLGSMSERFLKRLRRVCLRRGLGEIGSDWAIVVEAHRSGWPHVNLMVYAPALAQALHAETRERDLAGFVGRELIVLDHPGEVLGRGLRGEIGAHAIAAGWGIESTIERCRSREALASYLVKLAKHPDETLGELAKVTQLPLGAPFRFRRLRSGKGFLPPPRKNPEYTGVLVKRIVDEYGCRDCVVPSPRGGHRSDRVHDVETVERLELSLVIAEDLQGWARRHGRPVAESAVPSVSAWIGESLQRELGPPGAKRASISWDECRAAAYRLSAPEFYSDDFERLTRGDRPLLDRVDGEVYAFI